MGNLPDSDAAKPTLLTASGTIGHTPKNSWQKDYIHTTVKMELKKDGSIIGKSTWTPRGVEENLSRAYQFGYKNRDQQEVVGKLLARSQETGRGEFLENDPTNFETPWKIESEFKLDSLVNVPGPSAMTIPYGLVSGDLRRLAAYTPPDDRQFPDKCGSRAYVESITLTFPKGITIKHIPPDVKSSHGAYHYSATYKLRGHELQIERDFASKRDTPFCSAKDDKDRNALRAVLQRDLRGQVFLN